MTLTLYQPARAVVASYFTSDADWGLHFDVVSKLGLQACVLSSFSTNLKLGLIAPAVIILLLNLKSAAMTGKAAWATEWLGELQIANCYRQDKDGNWGLKDPYRQLVGKVGPPVNAWLPF